MQNSNIAVIHNAYHVHIAFWIDGTDPSTEDRSGSIVNGTNGLPAPDL